LNLATPDFVARIVVLHGLMLAINLLPASTVALGEILGAALEKERMIEGAVSLSKAGQWISLLLCGLALYSQAPILALITGILWGISMKKAFHDSARALLAS